MVANADKVREIGTKEAEREKLVRLADLAKDAASARAAPNSNRRVRSRTSSGRCACRSPTPKARR